MSSTAAPVRFREEKQIPGAPGIFGECGLALWGLCCGCPEPCTVLLLVLGVLRGFWGFFGPVPGLWGFVLDSLQEDLDAPLQVQTSAEDASVSPSGHCKPTPEPQIPSQWVTGMPSQPYWAGSAGTGGV